MKFLSAWFLLAALAAAIPVILHMINRQKARQLPFSTLRFLRISVQKTRRRKRVHDVLLMLLRAAVLVFIAAGLAHPTLTSLSSLWGGSGTAVAVVLDNSASMGSLDKGRTRFETALAAVEQILGELREGDQAALFLTGGKPFPEQGKLDRTRDGVRQMLNQCSVSYERADLGIRVRQAQKLLADCDAPSKMVYVVTDMQKHCWDSLKPDATSADGNESGGAVRDSARDAVPVVIVDCNRDPQPNLAVHGVEIEAVVPVAGLPIKANAEIYDAAAVERTAMADLYVNDTKEASSPQLNIPAEGRRSHAFSFVLPRGGSHRGEIRLPDDDGNKLDNRRFFSLDVDQGLPVAIVTPKRHEIAHLDDAFYVQQALSPGRSGGWALKATMLESKDLLAEPLSSYTAVFLVNQPAPARDVAERLQRYVDAGGNLVWIAGDNVQAEAYNQMNREAQDKLLPGTLLDRRVADAAAGRDSWSIGFLEKKHKALASLVEPPSLHQSVLVYKHVRIGVPEGSGATVLARLDDGEPLLVQKRFQRGSATLLGCGAQFGDTNLPTRPIFLPLLAQLTLDLAGARQVRRSLLAGTPLVLPLEDEATPVTVEVVPPSGEMVRLPSKAEQGTPGQVFRYNDTHEVGFYSVRVLEGARPRQMVFAVNVEPDEALPEKIDREELRERFAPSEVVFAEDPEDLSGTFKSLREGRSLWTLFLACVLAFLVFETFVSNRLSPKQDEDSQTALPPGMRRLAREAAATGSAARASRGVG